MRFLDGALRTACLLAAASGLCAGQEQARVEPLVPRNEQTYRDIVEAARDPNRDVRAMVAWSIAQMKREQAVETLAALAGDPAPVVRVAALRAVRQILPRGAKVAVTLESPADDMPLRRESLAAAQCLLFSGRDELIQNALKSSDAAERQLGVEALDLDQISRSRPALEAALKDPETLVRAEAVRALGRSGSADVAAVILPFLTDKSSAQSFVLRAAAAEAFGLLPVKPTPQEMYGAVGDEHFVVRRAAIRSLAKLKDMGGAPAIQGRVAESDYTVRLAACEALGVLIAPGSPPLLVERMADDFEEVRTAAKESLMKFPPDMAYAAVLKNADNAQNRELRARTWDVLAHYAHPATRDVASAHVRDDQLPVRGSAWHILRKLHDERIVAPAMALLRFNRSKAAPADPMGEEAYGVAIEFDQRQAIADTMSMLKLYADPPEIPPPSFPSDNFALGGMRYVVVMDYKEGAPVLEKILAAAAHERQPRALEMARLLEKLTGVPHPLPPPPINYGDFFIEAHGS